MAENFDPRAFSPVGRHFSVVIGTGQYSPPNAPSNAFGILVQALTSNIRYTIDGTNPTSSTGFQMVASDPPIIIPLGTNTFPEFIGEAAGAILEYQWIIFLE